MISDEILSSSVSSLFPWMPVRAWDALRATLWARLRLSTKTRHWPPSRTSFTAMLMGSVLFRGLRCFMVPSLKIIRSLRATPSLRGTGLQSVLM